MVVVISIIGELTMREHDDTVEFKAFAVGAAIAILYPFTVHYAGLAFFHGPSAEFLLKLFFGVAAIVGGVCLRIPVLSTAIVVGGLVCFFSALVFQWASLTPTLRFWAFFASLILVSALGYYYEKTKRKA